MTTVYLIMRGASTPVACSDAETAIEKVKRELLRNSQLHRVHSDSLLPNVEAKWVPHHSGEADEITVIRVPVVDRKGDGK